MTVLELKIGDVEPLKLHSKDRHVLRNVEYEFSRRGRIKNVRADEKLLYLKPTGVLRMTTQGSEFYCGTGTYIRISFEEVLQITNPSIDLNGYVYNAFHYTTFRQTEGLPSFAESEAAILNLIAKDAIKEEHKPQMAYTLLFACLMHDPELREPLAQRFPCFWHQWANQIKQAEFRRQFETTIWTLLEACPEFRGEMPTVSGATECAFVQDEQKFNDQIKFLRESLRRMRKQAPPMYHRILTAAVEAIEKEATALHRATVGAEMLKAVQKAK
jgi:hypothetical protein